jgi:hypothetical protein
VPLRTEVTEQPITRRYIALEDKTPIIETLQTVAAEVRGVIDSFASEF